MSFIRKHKKVLSDTWYNSESEEETANIVMAYTSRYDSDGESSTEELS